MTNILRRKAIQLSKMTNILRRKAILFCMMTGFFVTGVMVDCTNDNTKCITLNACCSIVQNFK